ncbi:hypothetical protein DV736_g372, partial [Chaetothyriales sp. CBS 134916]
MASEPSEESTVQKVAEVSSTTGLKEFTVQEVAEHSTRKDLYFTIHDKPTKTSFCRGGEEVLVDVAGQDATEAFEDVGHSDEAREILNGLLMGKIKGSKPVSSTAAPAATYSGSTESSFGLILYAVVFAGGLISYLAYQYLQSAQAQEQK